MRLRAHGFALACLCLLLGGTGALPAHASSHSEAPGTAKDRLADDTDLYAFVAPDAPGAVTFVGNWVPLIEPNSGPNFASFDDDATYWLNVDNVGDARAHIRYQFTFRTTRQNDATFLYNTGVVRSLMDANLNVRQSYTVTRWVDGVPTVLGSALPVAPAYVGPVSMPDYAALAGSAVQTLSDGSKVFAGPRDDPFFVDLAATFDLLTIRKPPGDRGRGLDGLAGFDVMSIVLQVPKARLTSDGAAPGPNTAVIGVYASTERAAQRTLNADGTVTTSGDPVQVSRLGMPLVNEVVVPLGQKDRFNAAAPISDGQFLPSVVDPELAHLLTALYGISTPPAPRNDLVTVFLTGVPGLNQPPAATQVPCEMLRLNMTIAPAAKPSRFGILAGDVAGFPNGRRLADDVVDIAERVVAGATPFTPDYNVAPNNRLGDGVDWNDRPFLPYFPYVALPHDPLRHSHEGRQVQFDPFGDHDRGRDDDRDGRGHDLVTGNSDRDGAFGLRFVGRNPAPEGLIECSLPQAGRVQLEILDVQGRRVRMLVSQDAAAGTFRASWDGSTDDGTPAGRGVYFARLTAAGTSASRKLVLQ